MIFRSGWLRLWTMIVVISLCIPAIFLGWQIAHFARESRSTVGGDTQDLRRWASVPGLRFSALQDSYSGGLDGDDIAGAAKRVDELMEILSVAPLSSAHWLLLSGMRQVAKESATSVSGALSMSRVTGANEDYIQPQRGIFAIALWEQLPDDIRDGAARDLSGALKRFNPVQRQQLLAILATKRDEVRQDIIANLMGSGRLSSDDLVSVGLKPDEFRK
jgi:hypothetical protein